MLKKEELNPEELSEKDIRFIFYHPNGCSCNQLALHLGIHPTTLLRDLKRGVDKR